MSDGRDPFPGMEIGEEIVVEGEGFWEGKEFRGFHRKRIDL